MGILVKFIGEFSQKVITLRLFPVQMTLEMDQKPQISGGPLVGKYEFVQLHFHWGSNDREGSENKINNNR